MPAFARENARNRAPTCVNYGNDSSIRQDFQKALLRLMEQIGGSLSLLHVGKYIPERHLLPAEDAPVFTE